MSGAERIRALLRENRPLVLGGVYDGVTTRLAEQAGFEALFVGGFSVAATLLGEPDFGYVTQTEMADAARRLCRLTSLPILVDADTGYGNALNALRTAELYHAAGAAGLFLEDQVWPKRCGHMRGKHVVERGEWLAKLEAVRSCRGQRYLHMFGCRVGDHRQARLVRPGFIQAGHHGPARQFLARQRASARAIEYKFPAAEGLQIANVPPACVVAKTTLGMS